MPTHLTEDMPAPAFTGIDQNGKQVSLDDYKGKKLVLFFYPEDDTPTCTIQACNLRDNYNALQKQGFEVLGVSTDSEKSHQKFIEKDKLPFTLLADPDRKLHDAFGTWVEKSMYGRNYMGTARVTFVIDEKGVIEEVIGKVDTANHTAQILKSAPALTPKPEGAAKPAKPEAKKVVKKIAPKKAKTSAKKIATKVSKKAGKKK